MARTGRKKEGKDSVDQERLAMEVVASRKEGKERMASTIWFIEAIPDILLGFNNDIANLEQQDSQFHQDRLLIIIST